MIDSIDSIDSRSLMGVADMKPAGKIFTLLKSWELPGIPGNQLSKSKLAILGAYVNLPKGVWKS